jgi:ribose transport system substrate-binding protein
MAMTVAACGSGTAATSESSPDTSSAESSDAAGADSSAADAGDSTSADAPGSADASASGDAGGDMLIGFSQRQIGGNAWYKTIVDGATAQAKESGVTIKIAEANNDTVQQNSDIQTFISSGAKAVIINPSDPAGLASSIKALGDANIPFVVVNSNLSDELQKKAFCYISEDQTKASELVGEQLAKDLEAKGKTSGTIKGLVVGGFPGEVVTQIRNDGLLKGMNDYFASKNLTPDIKMLPIAYGQWAPDLPLSLVRDTATANPDVSFVFVEADVMVPATLQALQQAGAKDAIVGGYNAQMTLVKQMQENPDGQLQAEVSDGVLDQGKTAVTMAIAAANGDTTACPGGTHFTDSVVVTPQTAADYYVADRAF